MYLFIHIRVPANGAIFILSNPNFAVIFYNNEESENKHFVVLDKAIRNTSKILIEGIENYVRKKAKI